jgi:Anti-sigma-K factor rskA
LQVNEIISSGLLELYVLGKTSEQETQQVLAWKVSYPEVAAELLAIEDSLEQLDFAKAVTPSIYVKKNLFATLHKTAQPETTVVTPEAKVVSIQSAPNNRIKYVAAASIALLLGSAVVNMVTYNKYNTASNALAKAEKEIATQNENSTALKNNMDVAFSNYSQPVVLKGTATAPSSTAKIFWIRNTNEVYVEPSGLPEAPKGFQYQLWAIVDGQPVDAGMIIFNKGEKYNIQKMKSFGKAQAFAITLEKQGGSPTPTMEKMYVMSTI